MNNLDILLVSEKYMKENTSVMDNVEDKFIRTGIIEAQNIDLQQVIGTPLYEDIITEFQAYKNYQDNPGTGATSGITAFVSQENLDLVDGYIQPVVMYYTIYNSFYELYAKLTNKGIVTQNSDNSTTITDNLFYKMRAEYKDKAEWYSERLMNYLLANQTTYPLYLGASTDIDDIQAETDTNYFAGMYLGRGKKGCFFDKNKRDL